jgi:type I restriction enzyme M protein
VVALLVEMLQPYMGRVYDPCCGSGGMFVQSVKFIEAHGGQRNDLAVYGQESNPTTWKLCAMNLAIRGIEADLGAENADSFRRDLHPDLKADFVIANPPFNDSHWNGEMLRDDVRWKYGVPPAGNANFAWVQHFVHHLAPGGVAGFVLANGSLSTQSSGEGEIRRRLIDADLVDCVVALPGQLFYSTPIPVSLWFLARGRGVGSLTRKRSREVLFVDGRSLGHLVDRTHRDLSAEEIGRISSTYATWRTADTFVDVPGFAKSATIAEIASHAYVLSPARYVAAATPDAGDERPIDDQIEELKSLLEGQFEEAARLQQTILEGLLRVDRG